MPDLNDYVTTQDASKLLQFHVEHVRRMLRDGDLKGLKVGKTWLVLRESITRYQDFTKDMGKYDPKRGRK